MGPEHSNLQQQQPTYPDASSPSRVRTSIRFMNESTLALDGKRARERALSSLSKSVSIQLHKLSVFAGPQPDSWSAGFECGFTRSSLVDCGPSAESCWELLFAEIMRLQRCGWGIGSLLLARLALPCFADLFPAGWLSRLKKAIFYGASLSGARRNHNPSPRYQVPPGKKASKGRPGR